MGRKKLLIFTLIFSVSFALFYPVFSYYFFQDDWFVLNWVRTGSLLSFLSFRTDIIYWRPLSMPLLFFSAFKFFGLNSYAFHILSFSLFCLTVTSVYKLFKKLTKNESSSTIAAFMYSIWSIHFISLSWFSTTSYIIGPFFQCLSFIYYLNFEENKNNKALLKSVLFFALGTSASEFTLIIPAIFFASSLIQRKKIIIKPLIPFLVIGTVYLLFRIFLFPIPASGTYHPAISTQIISNLLWYCLWSLGIPESFKDLMFIDRPSQSIRNLIQFWQISIPFLLLISLICFQAARTFKKFLKVYLFGIVWFIVGLLPVITLTSHSYPLYLSFSGLGIILILVTIFQKNKYLLFVFLILWLFVNYSSIRFTRLTHWIRNEQAISKSYVAYAKKAVVKPQNNSIFIFKPADVNFSQTNHFTIIETEDNIKQSLNNQDAMKVVFNNQSLKSLYVTWQQSVNIPNDVQVFEIAPRENK